MMSKKGISTVVATLLIILLTVIAVTVVWQILKPTLTSTAGKVGAGCVGMDMNVTNCSGAGSTKTVTVMVKAGAGTIPNKLKIIFYDSATKLSYNATLNDSIPGVMETKQYIISGVDSRANSVNVAGIITSGGSDQVCDLALTSPLTCS